MDAQYGPLLKTSTQLAALKGAWNTLKARRATGQADPALYTPLIGAIRGLITQVGDTSNLILDPDLDSYYVMDAVLLKLPEGQDRLAQTIALGEQVIARGDMTPQERAQLITLGGLVQANREETERGLNIAFRNNPAQNLMPTLDQPLRNSSAATDGLVITLTEQVVKPGAITLMAEPYHTAGTTALAKSFALWDRAVVQLDQMLQRRIDGFAEQQNFVLVVTAVGLLLVIYLWIGFYASVRRTVTQLDRAAQSMVSGDLTAP